jgi:ABC-type multidrug transport system ATPase subunit
VEQTATDLVVIHKGRLRYQGPIDGLAKGDESLEVSIRANDASNACGLLAKSGFKAEPEGEKIRAQIHRDKIPAAVKALVEGGVLVYEITPRQKNLEARFLSLLEEDGAGEGRAGEA